LYVCLSARLSVCLTESYQVCLSALMFFVCLQVTLSHYLSIFFSLFLSLLMFWSVCRSFCLSICLFSIYLFFETQYSWFSSCFCWCQSIAGPVFLFDDSRILEKKHFCGILWNHDFFSPPPLPLHFNLQKPDVVTMEKGDCEVRESAEPRERGRER